jgi:hypothetical protein
MVPSMKLNRATPVMGRVIESLHPCAAPKPSMENTSMLLASHIAAGIDPSKQFTEEK